MHPSLLANGEYSLYMGAMRKSKYSKVSSWKPVKVINAWSSHKRDLTFRSYEQQESMRFLDVNTDGCKGLCHFNNDDGSMKI
jgi:hypothetical protein